MTAAPVRQRSPLALARLQRRLAVGDRIAVTLSADEDPDRLRRTLEGAGFGAIRRRGDRLVARRERTLPDYVRARLRLLICGLNPSLHAAETGIPFGRPGNRFWPAARDADLVDVDRDPFAAVRRGIGFTDLAKRATRGASELDRSEYAAGLERVRALVEDLRPARVCFVGLDGWRRVVDRRAPVGWSAQRLAERPTYLMPSTSGRNAHATRAELAMHLRKALADPN